ncbi:MAG: hypothetical protein Kow0022_13150 [Phycisphaerales bacterium]
MGQGLGNYIQFIIFALFIGFSVISWVVRKLNEQRIRRQILLQRERERLEALRTGRVVEQPETPPPPQLLTPEQRLAEIARRRQAELAKRRQARQQAPVGVRTTPVPPPTVQGPSPRTPMPRPGGLRGSTTRPPTPASPKPQPRPQPVPAGSGKLTPAQRRAMVLEERRRALEARRSAQPAPPVSARETEKLIVHPDHQAQGGFSATRPDKPESASRLSISADLSSPQTLRKVFVLKEILDPPVALRHESWPV